MRVDPPSGGPLESPGVPLRLESALDGTARTFEAELPRPVLQRLVLGREADRSVGRPLPGLAPLPGALGQVTSVMVLPHEEHWRPPWEVRSPVLSGEEDPLRLARALKRWWDGSRPDAPSAVVGVNPAVSPSRWNAAPRPGSGALLLLPPSGFDGARAELREAIAGIWNAERVVASLPQETDSKLVVLIGAEPPGRFGRRLRELSRDARMEGRLLAVWCLSGPIRPDLAGSLLAEGKLAGIGIAESTVVLERRARDEISALQTALGQARSAPQRVERLPGPFLWHF